MCILRVFNEATQFLTLINNRVCIYKIGWILICTQPHQQPHYFNDLFLGKKSKKYMLICFFKGLCMPKEIAYSLQWVGSGRQVMPRPSVKKS